MIHRANADFWKDYRRLPADIRDRADKQFALRKANPQHPSLHFKKTLKYRALAVKVSDEYVWFWIGEHNVYDTINI